VLEGASETIRCAGAESFTSRSIPSVREMGFVPGDTMEEQALINIVRVRRSGAIKAIFFIFNPLNGFTK